MSTKNIIQALTKILSEDLGLEASEISISENGNGGATVELRIEDLEEYEYLVDDEGADRLAEDNEDGE